MFPDFNLYSTTLLILAVQGLVFAFLLMFRFIKQRKISDFFLAILLIITCYSTTSYVVGFMSWYDTFRTTKINYFLFDVTLVLGPLVYFYIRSVTQPYFKLKKIDFLHFFPFYIGIALDLFMYFYDASQSGFEYVQNGVLYGGEFGNNVRFISQVFGLVSQAVYYTIAIRLFLTFRKTVLQFFSNTYKVELNWIRNFLLIYISLFLLNQILFSIVDEFFYQLSWTHAWWWFFAAALSVFYLGISGYFSDVSNLNVLEPVETELPDKTLNKELNEHKNTVDAFMKSDKPFLNPDITLSELASSVSLTSNQLSMVINNGFEMNFNDYINQFRVEEVKQALMDESNSHLSILGIAFDCGFNSKATFNRVFKKFTDYSPSQFLAQQKK